MSDTTLVSLLDLALAALVLSPFPAHEESISNLRTTGGALGGASAMLPSLLSPLPSPAGAN